jgi:RNA polymerase sigma-70 factor (ECF subfamily)
MPLAPPSGAEAPEDALARAAQACRPRLLAAAGRILRDHGEAEDAVQDALLSALRSLHRFRGEAQLSSWLHRITVNAALMRLRARRRRPLTSLEDLGRESRELPDADALLADVQLAFRQEYGALAEAFGRLSECQREALLLRGVEELPIPEVARRIRRSSKAAKMLVHRARARLRADPAVA